MTAEDPIIPRFGVGLINFNTDELTLDAVGSLLRSEWLPDEVAILDNGSSERGERLESGLVGLGQGNRISFHRSSINSGFAGGSNFLIDRLIEAGCDYIILMNSDIECTPSATRKLVEKAMEAEPDGKGMVGGVLNEWGDRTALNTRGIAVFKSLMPADIINDDEVFIGPTGGFCLLERTFVEDMKTRFGHVFDPRFFCYSEDVDLALRAVSLGYRPALADEVLGYHIGKASSASLGSEFVVWHGLRNNIWMQFKNFPLPVLLRQSPWIILANLMSIFKYVMAGRFRMLLSAYAAALRELPSLRKDRSIIMRNKKLVSRDYFDLLSGGIFRRGYISKELARVLGRQ